MEFGGFKEEMAYIKSLLNTTFMKITAVSGRSYVLHMGALREGHVLETLYI